MEELSITLTLNEINLILSGLGNMPYVHVNELIQKIQSQARGQLNVKKENE
ncbi:hypothetical protein SAMN05518672_103597 [Chitinophaga sp. CF118]|uniref:hypothetical protein n=1 Tax=Chitinophaga sp. CF118 TaxID=1884367 RepID=UPI0008E4186B|nr:hypothetical protein [Chitinophaga sp. CF118]SFD86793.1 hypothetical protein SAMN05518672_103597 [Chitinophaga sp. CF118]